MVQEVINVKKGKASKDICHETPFSIRLCDSVNKNIYYVER